MNSDSISCSRIDKKLTKKNNEELFARNFAHLRKIFYFSLRAVGQLIQVKILLVNYFLNNAIPLPTLYIIVN